MNNASIQRKNATLWLLVVIVGFFLASYYHYFKGVIYHLPYPHNTFLFDPEYQFSDFRFVLDRWYQYLPNEPLPYISYFPFTYLIIGAFRWIAKHSSQDVALYLLFIGFIVSFVKTSLPRLSFLNSPEKSLLLISTLFLSFPFIFSFDRANFELVVYIFLSFAFYYYKKDCDSKAGIFLGLATAIKLFPGVLVFIFIFQRKWKAVWATILSASFSTLAALIYLPESIFANIQRMLLNMKLFTNLYAIDNGGLDFGHSIFGLIKIINFQVGDIPVETLLTIYTPLTLIALAGILYFIYRTKPKFWEILFLLVGVMNLFPMVSSDYKLIHLFIPFLFWLDDESQDHTQIEYWLVWGLLFVPKRYFLFGPYYDGTIIDPLLMLIMLVNIFMDTSKQGQLNEKTN